jgi:hypothetical protein
VTGAVFAHDLSNKEVHPAVQLSGIPVKAGPPVAKHVLTFRDLATETGGGNALVVTRTGDVLAYHISDNVVSGGDSIGQIDASLSRSVLSYSNRGLLVVNEDGSVDGYFLPPPIIK